MAEQFRKTYISVTEFIDSWEKEIYQLNNLDYFSYLLINELALRIENDFFPTRSDKEQLHLSADEISTVAFNITDSLQGFFEKNCFGTCKYGCPAKLDEFLENENIIANNHFYKTVNNNSDEHHTKEHCLSSDILNYVVLDSLLDYYNYELGIILTETDNGLLDFAEFILNVIIQFIRSKGQRYLKTPQENATSYFRDLIQSDDSDWKINNINFHDDEDDELEKEPWKVDYSSIEHVFEEFFDQYGREQESSREELMLGKFEKYLTDFLELKRIEDLALDDLEEFFSVVLPHEMLSENNPSFDGIREIFSRFLIYLEFTRNVHLKIPYEKFISQNMPEIIRTFRITNNYHKNFPLVEFLLSEDNNDISLIEGFYEIDRKMERFFRLKDIHLNTYLEPVNISRLQDAVLKKSDIFHCQLIQKAGVWQIAHLEHLYPSVSKYYLY